jgi:hypothetical protein
VIQAVRFPSHGRRRVRFFAGILHACLWSMPLTQSALADAAAGRQPYAIDDPARALSKLQTAAALGEPEAEFRLGTLYEQGAGELQRDYKRADYWYRKAAEQGHTEALYRLALIWTTGDDNFPIDLTEAYKWAVLAAESKGVWGVAAANLKTKLDPIINPRDRDAGKQQAAAWKEARRLKKEEPQAKSETASPVLVPPPLAPPGKAAGGCPGWPFPSLRCSEQFPALPGAPPSQQDIERGLKTRGLPTLGVIPPPSTVQAEPPPPDARHEDWSELDTALNALIGGNLAFNTPEHMSLRKSQIIEAKISVNLPADVLLRQLSEAGNKVSAGLLVADRMAATLSGGGAFDVSPSGPLEQLISHQQVTSWTWEVTPKEVGTQYLILSFDAMLTVGGKEGIRNINTFKRPIEVEVGWPETPDEWFQWFRTLFENISWLWVTLLVPVALWIWNRFRKPPPPGPEQKAPSQNDKLSYTC